MKGVIVMTFASLAPYQIPGFEMRVLTMEDFCRMQAIREAVMAVLPSLKKLTAK